MKTITACVLALVAVSATGCVSKGKYDEAVAQTRLTRAEVARKEAALAGANAQLEAQRSQLAAQRAEMGRLEAQIDELARSTTLTGATKDAQIGDLQKRLAELRAQNARAEAQAALFHEIARRLRSQVDAGDLRIVIRDDRMVLQLPNDVLFDTGRTDIKPAGKLALRAVAEVLKTVPRHFQVAGHTDDVPIHNARFASNWELSSGRALTVLHYLIGEGVTPPALSAAGYADVDPVASNATPDGRKENRRTEITVMPAIRDDVTVP